MEAKQLKSTRLQWKIRSVLTVKAPTHLFMWLNSKVHV